MLEGSRFGIQPDLPGVLECLPFDLYRAFSIPYHKIERASLFIPGFRGGWGRGVGGGLGFRVLGFRV